MKKVTNGKAAQLLQVIIVEFSILIFLNTSCIQQVKMRQSCKLEKNNFCNGKRFNRCAKYMKHFSEILQIFANAKNLKKYIKHFFEIHPFKKIIATELKLFFLAVI